MQRLWQPQVESNPGISAIELTLSYEKDVIAMADFLIEQLTSLGVKAEKRPIGTHKLEGKEVDLPPVVLGSIGHDPKKASSIDASQRYPDSHSVLFSYMVITMFSRR